MSATPRLDAVAKALAVGAPPSPNRKEFPFVGSVVFQGIPVDIEQRKGDTRKGVDKDGHKWAIKMHAHYGEVRASKKTIGGKGVDGDRLDVYLGDDEGAREVYVIHQNDPTTGRYDEDKCMLAFPSKEAALACYRKQYDRPGFYGGCTTMSIDRFKAKLADKEQAGARIKKAMHPTQTDKAAKPPMPEPVKKAHDPEHAMAARFLTQSKLREAVNHTHTLAMKTQRFHWNVDGPDFPALHKLFGDQYDELGDAVDELAERYKAIGPGEIRAIEIPSFDDPKSAAAMCSILATDHAACAMICNALARRAEAAGDAGTVDLAGRRAAAHEKAAWMLRATARPEEKPPVRATTIIVAKRGSK